MTPDARQLHRGLSLPTTIEDPQVHFLIHLVNGIYLNFILNQGTTKVPPVEEEDNFFDLLSRFQSKRMDDQRCTLGGPENKENIKRPKIPSNPNLVSKNIPTSNSKLNLRSLK